jgi:hypothetical protein
MVMIWAGVPKPTDARQPTDKPEMLTIYPSGVAVILHHIQADLQAGRNRVNVSSLPGIVAPSAIFTLFDGTLTGTSFNMAGRGLEELIRHYSGKQIVLIDESDNRIEGTLVHTQTGLHIVQLQDNTYSYIPDLHRYRLITDDIPEGYLTSGQLALILDADNSGMQQISLYYRTQGLSWNAEHAFILNENEDEVHVTSSALLQNQTGMDFEDVRLRLIAGEIRLAGGGYMPRSDMMVRSAMVEQAMDGEEFERSEAFEYYAYDTKERVVLRNGDRNQVALFHAGNVKVNKKYSYMSQIYGGAVENGRVSVIFETQNKTSHGLGEPLPAGIVRVYRKTPDGIELVGESHISHSAVGSDIRISTGNAFDLRAEERMTEQRQLAGRVNERDFEIVLHNAKKEPVQVELSRRLGANEQIIRASHENARKDAHTAVFTIDVPAGGETAVTFTLRAGN